VKRALLAGALAIVATGVGSLAPVALGSVEAGAAPRVVCAPAGSTGFTAALVVTISGTTVSSSVDGTGCNVGIYVAPGANNVTISGITVSGAGDHGIMAENVSGLTVQNNTVQGNGVNPTPNLGTDKAIQLVGVSNSMVTGNTVTGNVADGGISVTDEGGGLDPAAPNGPAIPVASTNDTIGNNTVSGNYKGCGIIVEGWVPGAGVSGTTVSNNHVTGAPGVFGPHGPVIGQIIVATDAPGATVSNTTVTGNTVTGSFLSGLTVHSNAPGDAITATTVTGNTFSGNNWGHINGAPQTDAIALEVNPIPPPATPVLSGTTITGNTMSEYVGVWQSWQVTGTTMSGNTFTGTTLLFTQPVPGGGYWMTASDGGIFNFGNAGFYGSTGGMRLNAPVVGVAQTRDQGGYLLATSDGGVFTFGDANFYGSQGGAQLSAPVVGMAMTPAAGGPQGTPGTNGLGYWLVAADGGVFSYGDGHFFGSMGGTHLNKPVVGMAPTPDGLGYWLVASDGGVFNFGDASYFGSTGGMKLNKPVVGMAPTPSGKGYWLMASDGGVFTFGDAAFFGSMGGVRLNAPVVGSTATGSNGVAP
jgi:parallel beta-helix repeat protein